MHGARRMAAPSQQRIAGVYGGSGKRHPSTKCEHRIGARNKQHHRVGIGKAKVASSAGVNGEKQHVKGMAIMTSNIKIGGVAWHRRGESSYTDA